jgi:hypothetical protein
LQEVEFSSQEAPQVVSTFGKLFLGLEAEIARRRAEYSDETEIQCAEDAAQRDNSGTDETQLSGNVTARDTSTHPSPMAADGIHLPLLLHHLRTHDETRSLARLIPLK